MLNYQKNLRINPQKSELIFMEILHSLDIEFEFQEIIYANKKSYIIDFYLPDNYIVFEIDGGYHDTPEQRRKDDKRTINLISKKNVSKIVKEVIRYRNEKVDNINNRDNLINSILENLN